MKLKTLEVSNWRGIGHAVVDFGTITTFVGRHRAGKTSMLRALQFLFAKKLGEGKAETFIRSGATAADVAGTFNDGEGLRKHVTKTATTYYVKPPGDKPWCKVSEETYRTAMLDVLGVPPDVALVALDGDRLMYAGDGGALRILSCARAVPLSHDVIVESLYEGDEQVDDEATRVAKFERAREVGALALELVPKGWNNTDVIARVAAAATTARQEAKRALADAKLVLSHQPAEPVVELSADATPENLVAIEDALSDRRRELGDMRERVAAARARRAASTDALRARAAEYEQTIQRVSGILADIDARKKAADAELNQKLATSDEKIRSMAARVAEWRVKVDSLSRELTEKTASARKLADEVKRRAPCAHECEHHAAIAATRELVALRTRASDEEKAVQSLTARKGTAADALDDAERGLADARRDERDARAVHERAIAELGLSHKERSTEAAVARKNLADVRSQIERGATPNVNDASEPSEEDIAAVERAVATGEKIVEAVRLRRTREGLTQSIERHEARVALTDRTVHAFEPDGGLLGRVLAASIGPALAVASDTVRMLLNDPAACVILESDGAIALRLGDRVAAPASLCGLEQAMLSLAGAYATAKTSGVGVVAFDEAQALDPTAREWLRALLGSIMERGDVQAIVASATPDDRPESTPPGVVVHWIEDGRATRVPTEASATA